MARIRDDFRGVVHVQGAVLRAGDYVPSGAVLDPSFVDNPTDATPGKGGSRKAWAEFLTVHEVEFPEDATRNELIELWESTGR